MRRLLLFIALGGLACSHAASASALTWRTTPTPNPGPVENVLNATSGSPGYLWAVGRRVSGDPGDGGDWRPLIVRWSSTGWHVVRAAQLPADVTLAQLEDVVSVSRDDAWAVGIMLRSSTTRAALVEHWDGQSWHLGPAPPRREGDRINAITRVPGTGHLWVVGGFFGVGPQSAYWDGSSWRVVPMPPPIHPGQEWWMAGVAAISESNVWAVATTSTEGVQVYPGANPIAYHWNGTEWHVMELPPSGCSRNRGSPALSDITRVPGTQQLWAVGWCSPADTTTQETLVYHYAGGVWHKAPSPNPFASDRLTGVTASAPGDVWASGFASTREGGVPMVLHHTATGWHNASPPGTANAMLAGITETPTRVWAVGSYFEYPARTLAMYAAR